MEFTSISIFELVSFVGLFFAQRKVQMWYNYVKPYRQHDFPE